MSHVTPLLEVQVDGSPVHLPAGSSVAAALAQQRPGRTRLSVGGQWRAPLCGMGVCHECRVLVDGREALACQTACEAGMCIATGAAPAESAT